MLAACAKDDLPTPLARALPAAPAFARPVQVAAAQSGESCYVAYDRQRQGVKRGNSIIGNYNKWYAGVRQSYSAKQ